MYLIPGFRAKRTGGGGGRLTARKMGKYISQRDEVRFARVCPNSVLCNVARFLRIRVN